MDATTLQRSLLPFVLGFTRDRVPNVRFNVAKALEKLGPKCDAETQATLIAPALHELAAVEDADTRYYATKALAALSAGAGGAAGAGAAGAV